MYKIKSLPKMFNQSILNILKSSMNMCNGKGVTNIDIPLRIVT